MVPCRISRVNKISTRELGWYCMTRDLPRVATYARLTVPRLDNPREIYHAWTTHTRFTVQCLDNPRETYHAWFMQESTRMITDTTSHNIIIPVGE